ncbi:MAG: protein kinase domain-containing protein [Bradymonadia bacterium]
MVRICPECNAELEAEVCPKDGRRTVDAAVFKREQTDPYLEVTVDGKYRIETRLGHGGFGAVYRAQHVDTGGDVAIKILKRELADDETVVKRFYLEAQNTHKLHHPNTVRLNDFGHMEGGALYTVMEYVRGRTLASVLDQEGALPLARCVRIISQVLKSLGEAHEHALIHRDIKPDNVMLVDQYGETDFVKVLDFGIAKSLESSASITQGVVGTPFYMAPEQWLSLKPDHRADLYAVGCLLYKMLTGELPYDLKGAKPTVSGLMWAHVHGEVKQLTQALEGPVPRGLEPLLLALLAKSPDARPNSALDVLDALNDLDQIKDFGQPDAEVETHAGETLTGATLDADISIDMAGGSASARPDRPAQSTDKDVAPPANKAAELSGVWSTQQSVGGSKTPQVMLVVLALALVIGGVLVLNRSLKTEDSGLSEAQEPAPKSVAVPAAQPSATDLPQKSPAAHQTAKVGDASLQASTDANVNAQEPMRADQTDSPETPAAQAQVIELYVKSKPKGASVYLQDPKKELGQTPLSVAVDEQMLKALKTRGTLTLRFKRVGYKDTSRTVRWKDVTNNQLSTQVTLRKKRVRKPSTDKKTPVKAPAPKPAVPKKKKALPQLRTP